MAKPSEADRETIRKVVGDCICIPWSDRTDPTCVWCHHGEALAQTLASSREDDPRILRLRAIREAKRRIDRNSRYEHAWSEGFISVARKTLRELLDEEANFND